MPVSVRRETLLAKKLVVENALPEDLPVMEAQKADSQGRHYLIARGMRPDWRGFHRRIDFEADFGLCCVWRLGSNCRGGSLRTIEVVHLEVYWGIRQVTRVGCYCRPSLRQRVVVLTQPEIGSH